MTVPEINATQLRDMLEQEQPVIVLDVRETADRAEWAIPGSVHIDAYRALKEHNPRALHGVALPQDRTIITV